MLQEIHAVTVGKQYFDHLHVLKHYMDFPALQIIYTSISHWKKLVKKKKKKFLVYKSGAMIRRSGRTLDFRSSVESGIVSKLEANKVSLQKQTHKPLENNCFCERFPRLQIMQPLKQIV